jgi:hypothetical protein
MSLDDQMFGAEAGKFEEFCEQTVPVQLSESWPDMSEE